MSGSSKLCPACAAQFTCQNQGSEPCWCASLPAIMPVPPQNAGGCYCPRCLRAIIDEKIAQQPANTSADQAATTSN